MSAAFDEKIRKTLGDANLQLAIYAATGRLAEKRREAVAVLPDYQELREQANAVKRHTLENLDHYLQQFESAVTGRGGRVVYCKDGAEVAEFVINLAKERGARL